MLKDPSNFLKDVGDRPISLLLTSCQPGVECLRLNSLLTAVLAVDLANLRNKAPPGAKQRNGYQLNKAPTSRRTVFALPQSKSGPLTAEK